MQTRAGHGAPHSMAAAERLLVESTLMLEEVMHIVFSHLDGCDLLKGVWAVCRRWRAFVRTFSAPKLALNMAAINRPDRFRMIKLAAEIMPSAQAVRLVGVPGPALSRLLGFSALRHLDIFSLHGASVDGGRAWRMLTGPESPLKQMCSLTLENAKTVELETMAAAGPKPRLRCFCIEFSVDESLYSPARHAVLRLLQTMPNLTTLRLRNQALDSVEATAAMTACPGLVTLELSDWNSATGPRVLASVREHAGRDLADLTFALRPGAQPPWNPDVAAHLNPQEIRTVCCREAFAFFETRPAFRRLCLRNVDKPLAQFLVQQHLSWQPPAGRRGPHLYVPGTEATLCIRGEF